MSTNKYFERICCVVLAFALILTIVFMNSESLGLVSQADNYSEYEDKLFDTSSVHTINIIIDDWDGFLETATSEEYTQVDLEIDGETFYNVAIRGKGNTSLSSVEAYGNDRYSFKVEFDHYDSSTTYYGLDKLALNNIIQDNTYMKDYITYLMMAQFDVDTPLVSYTQILVNGEEWGLYLAVEGIEESFMQRNYGNISGDMYQPDSMSAGGGGDEMPDMDDFDPEEMEEMMQQMQEEQNNTFNSAESSESDSDEEVIADEATSAEEVSDTTEVGDVVEAGNAAGDGPGGGGGPGGMNSNDVALVYTDDDPDSYSNIFDSAKTDVTTADQNRLIESLKKLNNNEDIEDVVNTAEVLRYFVVHNFVVSFDSYTGSMMHNYYLYENDGQLSMIPWDYNLAYGAYGGMEGGGGGEGGPGGMGGGPQGAGGASATDETASTDTTTETGMENAQMPAMGNQQAGGEGMMPANGEGMQAALSDEGAIAPENEGMTTPEGEGGEGVMQMGGGMGGSNATSMVNYPIDDPLSGATMDERPMIAWIFNNEEYTEQYHELFNEFLDQFFANDEIITEIERVRDMIAPYVESDPTKFCTYEEFETGVDTLIEFMNLRAESVAGQLDGTIPSTSDGQDAEDSSLIDASHINLNDMGSMGAGGGEGGGPGGMGNDESTEVTTDDSASFDEQTDDVDNNAENADEAAASSTGDAGQSEAGGGNPPEMPSESNASGNNGAQGGGQMQGGPGSMPGNAEQDNSQQIVNMVLLGVSLVVIILGIIVAKLFRRRG